MRGYLVTISAIGSLASGAVAAPSGAAPPVVLASQQWSPHDLAIDATNAYFTDNDTVRKVALGGGAPVVLASSEHFPSSLVVDKANVYFVTARSTTILGGNGKTDDHPPAIRRVPLVGGAVSTLATLPRDASVLAMNGANLYWVDCSGAVEKVALGGGAITELVPGIPKGCGVSNFMSRLAIDATNAYFTTAKGALMKVPLVGGAATELIPAPRDRLSASRTGIAVDATNVYLSTANVTIDALEVGSIQQVPRAGGKPKELWSGAENPIAVAVDGAAVYWLRGTKPGDIGAEADDVSVVVRLPLGGGPPRRLVRGHAACAAGALAFDDASVYFTHAVCGPGGTITSQNGSIVRAPKQCPPGGCGPDVDGAIRERKSLGYMDELQGGACDSGMDMACEAECDAGSMLGCFKLGEMYRDGHSVARDARRATALFKHACKGGYTAACAH